MATDQAPVVKALYDDDDVLLRGVKEVREKGYNVSEVYSPFPVHGLDEAMGLKETRMAITAFFYGLVGLTFASLMTYGMLIVDWPMNIGGKPSFTWGENMPAFVPVMFELTVFFAAHLMVWTFFIRNGLYPGKKTANPDPRTTDNMFLMEVTPEDTQSSDELLALLRESGAVEVSQNKEADA
ncbi:MAG: DUF3341 domain-containing protein [Schleiferiaceae bacterium]|nr:DUF3341 domain-containing protein [Schleiferiaceae bacterium]MDR9441323.1 DUF3341 domain-containing protein [Schleiferiaceae bacterium]